MAQGRPHGFEAELLPQFRGAHVAELVGMPVRYTRLLARGLDAVGVGVGMVSLSR